MHPPTLFWVLSIAAIILDVGVLAFLWHKDTRAFCAAHTVESDARS